MLQENRAFDNYFGVFANYRVNVDHIPGAQMSDVNDLHTLPPNYTIKNPQGQSFGPFHERTTCIENLSPSWDETPLRHGPGGQRLAAPDAELSVQDGPLPRHDVVRRQRRSVRSHAHAAARLLRLRPICRSTTNWAHSLRPATTWYSPMPANTVPNRMYLFAATSYGHAFPPQQSERSGVAAADDLPHAHSKPASPGAITTRTTACSWRNGPTGTICKFRATFATFRSTTTSWRVAPPTEICRRSCSSNAGGVSGLDEHPDNNIQTGAAAHAADHYRTAQQRRLAGLGVHPDLR